MIFRTTYLLLLLSFFSLPAVPVVFAQQSIGVVWQTPENGEKAAEELTLFSELGIQNLELHHPVEQHILELLSGTEFSVMVRSEPRFLTLSQIEQQRSALTAMYGTVTDYYRTAFMVERIGLLSNSQVFHPDFSGSFKPILDSLSHTSNKNYYFFQGDAWFYTNSNKPFARLLFENSFQRSDLLKLNDELEYSQNPNETIFVHSEWLLEAVSEYPELTESLNGYHSGGDWLLPLPDTNANSQLTPNWIVLLLIILWGSLAYQLRFLPVSRVMILRYFLAHKFFADDILHYRERSATSGVILLIQHPFFGGLTSYLLAQILLSEAGLEAFFHHLPALAILGSNYASFFAMGFLLTLVFQLLALIWLHIPAKSLTHFSQTINLYTGIFQLDFIIVTIMLTLFLAGTGSTVLIILGILFPALWYAAFYITAADASKYLGPSKLIYLLLTAGLHTAATAIVILLILSSTELLQVFDLSFNL